MGGRRVASARGARALAAATIAGAIACAGATACGRFSGDGDDGAQGRGDDDAGGSSGSSGANDGATGGDGADASSDGATKAPDGGGSTKDGGGSGSSCATCPSKACDSATGECDPLVFITSESLQGGAIGGVDGADAVCNGLAIQAFPSSVSSPPFFAWLSNTSGAIPTNRGFIGSARAYRRMDGDIVAKSFTDIAQGFAFAIDQTEQKQTISNPRVWLNVDGTGNSLDGETCGGNWTKISSAMGTLANPASPRPWELTTTDDCQGVTHPIMCIQSAPK